MAGQKGKFVKSSRPDKNRNLWRGSINLMSPNLDTNIERPVITQFGFEDHIYFISDFVQEETVTTNDIITSKCEWKDGRRIVELDTLAINFKACKRCGQPLHLSDCVRETRFGLAQIVFVTRSADYYTMFPLLKKHETNKGGKALDINTKLATGKRKTSVCQHFW